MPLSVYSFLPSGKNVRMPDSHSRGQSYSRSLSPYSDRSQRDSPHRSQSRSRSVSRSVTPRPSEHRNGYGHNTPSRSPSTHREVIGSGQNRTRGGRWPRDRSNTRSPSPQSPPRRSSKVLLPCSCFH